MIQIQVRFNGDGVADFCVSERDRKKEVKLPGCYIAEVGNITNGMNVYPSSMIEQARKEGVQLPILSQPSQDELGKFLTLYFCQDRISMHAPLGEITKVPFQVTKSLDDALKDFNLTGTRIGRGYTSYSENQYRIRLEPSVQVLIQ